MAPVYTIEHVQDTTYVDQGGRPVNGFLVTFTVYELNETHSVNVRANNPVEIDKLIRAEIEKFRAIRKLGG